MTADEWETSADLDAMLALRQVGTHKRQLRLFAVACCRQLGSWVSDPNVWKVLAGVERYADGGIKASGLAYWHGIAINYWIAAQRWPQDSGNDARVAAYQAVVSASEKEPRFHPLIVTQNILADTQVFGMPFAVQGGSQLARLFRDIFGNPFRPVAFDPAWRSESAVALARAAYEARNFTLLPILADALEEAGCDHPDVLAHCRQQDATHVRGCWVVDLVLGKS